MKYKLVADTPAEQQALDSGNVALPVLDTLLPVIQARAIMAGVHLGVFEAIGHEARTTDEVAQSVAADSHGFEKRSEARHSPSGVQVASLVVAVSGVTAADQDAVCACGKGLEYHPFVYPARAHDSDHPQVGWILDS